ncbi:MAG: hypothetical protein A4E25_01759 [Methanobacterium sp. PtaB.Bin024]|nr:MAG: hypothetical protein A4E25_01759 [Methanobacterium sp. PtaB.Bin024]
MVYCGIVSYVKILAWVEFVDHYVDQICSGVVGKYYGWITGNNTQVQVVHGESIDWIYNNHIINRGSVGTVVVLDLYTEGGCI